MMLNPDQIREITSITDNMITKDFMIRLFGVTDIKVGAKYRPTDSFMLTKGMIVNYNEPTTLITTVGRFIFNVFLNVGCFGKQFPYFNSGKYDAFEKQLDYALIQKKINVNPQYSTYQTKRTWFEYTLPELVVPGLSFNILKPNPVVQKRKEELFKKYKKELDAGDVTISAEVEAELLTLAREQNKGDPAMRLYDLKKPSFGNNYKNMTIMVGAQPDNSNPGEYHITGTNYMDGINKNEYHNFADQLISGSYNRSVETQKGGAITKEFQAALQTTKIDQNNDSDCHTRYYQKITLNDMNIEMYLWKFVVGDNGLTQITPDNMKQFIGKPLRMRSTQYCGSEKMCSKCAGTLYSTLNIEDAGITSSIIPVTIQQIAMKSMHDATIKTNRMNFAQYFKDY